MRDMSLCGTGQKHRLGGGGRTLPGMSKFCWSESCLTPSCSASHQDTKGGSLNHKQAGSCTRVQKDRQLRRLFMHMQTDSLVGVE